MQTKLVVQVIFRTILMQPHHHDETVTRMLQRALQYLKCILPLSCVYFEREIPSVWLVGFGYPTTSPKSREPWPFGATSFPPPLSSSPCLYQYWLDTILDCHKPAIGYWLEQTAFERLFREGSHLWVSTASTYSHFAQGENWPQLQHREV